MGKHEAIDLLNEIMKTCIMPRFITIETSNPNAPVELRNYALKIGDHFDTTVWDCLKRIVRKRSLSMKEVGNYVVIYREQT